MANQILTHKMIAREAAKMLEEEAPFLANVNKGRQEEFGEAVNGYKTGDSVDIEVPRAGVVFDGPVFAGGGAATDVIQDKVPIKLDTQKHIGIKFTSKEQKLDLTDFKERILRPQIRTLSSVVEADLIRRAVIATPNLVGTPGSAISTMKTSLPRSTPSQNINGRLMASSTSAAHAVITIVSAISLVNA